MCRGTNVKTNSILTYILGLLKRANIQDYGNWPQLRGELSWLFPHSWQQCSLCGAIELRSWQLCVTVCWHFAKHTFIPLWTRTLLVSYIPTIISQQYFIPPQNNECPFVKTNAKPNSKSKGGFSPSKYI